MIKKDILCRLDDSYSESMLGFTEEVDYEFLVPREYEYVTAEEFDKDEEEEEVTVASLWENIRKKKQREGKNYKPAKPGEKDRPDPKAWKKAQSRAKASMIEFFFRDEETALDMAKKIGLNSVFTHTTKDGDTFYIPGTCMEDLEEWYENEEEITEELNEEAMAAEYQGRKVTLNKPFRTSNGPKKFAVYTKNESGNVVIVRFGDPERSIKKHIPERRKAFRARHNCDNPGPKWKARYWSCQWSW
jgi:hypothetical protein